MGQDTSSQLGLSQSENCCSDICSFQESGDRFRRNADKPLVWVSVSCFLQCFDTVCWVTVRTCCV